MPQRRTATPKSSFRSWQLSVRILGETEGDNHRVRAAVDRLAQLLRKDEHVQRLFSVLRKRHAKAFVNGLDACADSVVADVQASIWRLVKERMDPAYEAIALVLYGAFLAHITQPTDRRITVKWTAEPVPPPDLLTQIDQNHPCRGETLEQYRERTQHARPEPLKKGRKPRNQGRDMQQAVEWFYQMKWTKNVTQYQVAKDYATARGLTGDHRSRVRSGVAEIDALLQRLATPVQIVLFR